MRFGIREICNVTFKATANGQKIGKKEFKAGQPAFFIDTAKTSNLTQESTTVYATGGQGNARLIAWEGEKTMTFVVEDALISPQGLAVLSGAGLLEADENNKQHFHITLDKQVTAKNDATTAVVTYEDLIQELGVATTDFKEFEICTDIPSYATKLDASGSGIGYYEVEKIETADADKLLVAVKSGTNATFTITGDSNLANNDTVKLDFYVVFKSGVTNINIAPESFGGYFYVEADTLFRSEATGKDLAATITIPRAKVQSAMTFTMASSGDPSTFTFTLDAFPGYTYFNRTKKTMAEFQILGVDGKADNLNLHDEIDVNHTTKG